MKHSQELNDAMAHAYRNVGELEQLTLFDLGVRLQDAVTLPNRLPQVIFELLQWAESEGRLGELAWAAHERKPGNPKLAALMSAIRPARALSGDRAFEAADWKQLDDDTGHRLEQVVLEGVAFQDVAPWLDKLGRLYRRVCRVEPQPVSESKAGFASGFLVASDVIMTNCHVAEGLDGRAGACVRFDYAVDKDGVTTHAGRTAALARDWSIARGSVADLDFALVRLAERAGDDDIGGAPRGSVALTAHALAAGDPILIVQHPDAGAVKLAWGSVLEPSDGGKRVTYNANTLGGSSGSPCLSVSLELVALHRSGKSSANVGIRIDAIRAFLAAAGVSFG